MYVRLFFFFFLMGGSKACPVSLAMMPEQDDWQKKCTYEYPKKTEMPDGKANALYYI